VPPHFSSSQPQGQHETPIHASAPASEITFVNSFGRSVLSYMASDSDRVMIAGQEVLER
jgi:hypothetical protein